MIAVSSGQLPRPDERLAMGKAARAEVPHAAHAEFHRPPSMDPLELLAEQAADRVPELVPIRHGRMLASPFSYFRGAALPMAADLADTPRSGFEAQLCGDAHLSNFGFFGSPERRLVFDVNDFDETAPGPWEWDVKRLAASLEIAGRDREFATKERGRIVRRGVRAYREAMRAFAQLPSLQVWYARLDVDELLPRFARRLDPTRTPSLWRAVTKARAHDSLQAFDKLTHEVNGEILIAPDPPLIVPIGQIVTGLDVDVAVAALQLIIEQYRRSLPPERRRLLDQYRFAQLARKVVGVGSVGTEAWIALLLDQTTGAPLFLQIKEAQASVLERYSAECEFSNHGERVVVGQRLMQAASDILLGWEQFTWNGRRRDYYFRQLRDWKGTADMSGMTPDGMRLWARMCGWTLARAHARSGDRLALAAYLGRSDGFDRAVAAFAASYADQNALDHHALAEAVVSGRLSATTGV